MWSGYGSTGGTLPVWVTVVIACVGGGFAAGAVDGLFLASASPFVSHFMPAAIAGVTAGAALYYLMPSLSSRMVGLGTAVLAGFSGAMVGVVTSRLMGSGGSTWIVSTVASVVLISWMVSGAATAGAQFRQRPKNWSEIDAIDREGTELQHEQAERGYWGSMQEPDAQDES